MRHEQDFHGSRYRTYRDPEYTRGSAKRLCRDARAVDQQPLGAVTARQRERPAVTEEGQRVVQPLRIGWFARVSATWNGGAAFT